MIFEISEKLQSALSVFFVWLVLFCFSEGSSEFLTDIYCEYSYPFSICLKQVPVSLRAFLQSPVTCPVVPL